MNELEIPYKLQYINNFITGEVKIMLKKIKYLAKTIQKNVTTPRRQNIENLLINIRKKNPKTENAMGFLSTS